MNLTEDGREVDEVNAGDEMHEIVNARLEFVRDGKKWCNMELLDADVKRPLASVSAIVDEGNIVVFGPQESHIENTSTGQRIPTIRRKGVFVVRLDAQAGSSTAKIVKFDEPNTNEVTLAGFQAASLNRNVEEHRERCETQNRE